MLDTEVGGGYTRDMEESDAKLLVADFLAEMSQEVEALLNRRMPELVAEYRERGADIPNMGDAEWLMRGALLQCRDALADDSVREAKEATR